MHKAYFDASYNWSNGTATLAYVIYNPKKKAIDKEIFITTTDDSNHAEWIALARLLRKLKELGIKNVIICGDNRNVIDIANGRGKGERNVSKRKIIEEYIPHFKNITFKWVARNENNEADRLSKNKKVKGVKNKIVKDTYITIPKMFDFNFKYREKKKKVIAK
ncbi:reverse transcriptase-like protein [Brevibacillus gelatini]|uniref:reverse transcriptase-like protein n=1 Tax=Brevibacillus gelatini TaxID=1655277 RepID=UPI00147664EA|nr:reverse transcriptase-like protein [Brevibacillus gelatini]